jgi:enoyl-[acyl-carrier protein] reductase III
MIDLSGKVALVTGSSRGIGQACALKLAEAGADIVLNYVTSQAAAMRVAESIDSMGRQVAVIKADVSEPEDVEEMMSFVEQTFGRLNIVVSNAATGGFRSLLDADSRHFDAAMHTNVRPLIYLVQQSLRLLEQGPDRGKVIALTSHGSMMALPSYGLIGASKAALEALVRHLTLDVGHRNVNVNAVRAGLVDTDSTRRLPDADRLFAGRTNKTMMGERVLTAEDVAGTVLFLASPLSDLIQGETITVDGGVAIHV